MLSSFQKLFSLFNRREKVKTLGLLVLMVVVALMEMVGIGAIPAFILVVGSPEKVLAHPVSGAIADWLGVENSYDLLVTGSIGLITLFIVKGLLISLVSYIRIRFVQYKYTELSDRLFRAYMFAPFTFHLSRNSSGLLRNVINETSILMYSVFNPILNVVLNLITMGLIMAVLFAAQPLFSLVAMTALGLVTFGMLRFVQRQTAFFGKQEQNHRQISNKAVMEGLAGIKDIRVLGRERFFTGLFAQSTAARAKAQYFIGMVGAINRPVFETVTVVGVLALALALSARDQSIERIIAILALFGAATYRLMPLFQQLMADINSIRYYLPSIHPVYNDLNNINTIDEVPEKTIPKSLQFSQSINFKSISYSYPDTNNKVVKDIDLTIPFGSAVAFVGSSGAGKTTLADLLLGLLQPLEGTILVDGTDISTNLRAWQQNIGYIPQNIYLADDTLRRNVAFGLPEETISDAQFWSAVQAAQLTELIEQLPDKEHTLIGEAGIRLSGGQRQRIGIARALYHNPRLLVMDEGTSALDNVTEKFVIEAIENLRHDRTILMIAHRLTTVKNCDVIYYMEEGRIIDAGTYSELLQRNPGFMQMASMVKK